MSIQYLNTSTQMKIRPVSDEDVLFEMETNEFMTTCCRVDTSYDLVVRDITSGAMLFCISGAEIEDHPLDVYISDNRPIGRMEGLDIYVHGQNTQYTIQGSSVTTTAGLVTLNWPTNFSVELKALSIAFALNIAMTKHKGTVIDGADIRSTTPVDVIYPSLLPSTQSEACPRNNRLITPSIFSSQSGEQEFWLTVAGRQCCSRTNIMFLISSKTKRVVAHMRSRFSDNNLGKIMNALDIDGTEQFTANWIDIKKSHNQLALNLTSQGQSIGRVIFNANTKEYRLYCYENESSKEIYTRTTIRSKAYSKTFLDSDNRKYGEIDNFICTAFHMKFAAGISSTIKKFITCISYYNFGYWMKIFHKLPAVRISRLVCNCDYCQHPITYEKNEPQLHDNAYTSKTIIIKPVGHNRVKNVIYFNVQRDAGGYIVCTLEVTPIENFQGVTKIEGRNAYGSLLFTSLHYKEDNIFTLYGRNGQLLAYAVDNFIYNDNKVCILTLNKHKRRREISEDIYGPNIQFYIKDVNRVALSTISPQYCTMKLYRNRLPVEKPSTLHVYLELIIAAKLYSYPYEFDKIPTPEMLYCYRRARNMEIKELE